MPTQIPINTLAIIVVDIIFFLLGWLWYSPALFGKVWGRGLGKSDEELGKMMREGMGKIAAWNLIGGLILAFVLEHAIVYSGADTIFGGIFSAFWNWLGFIVIVLSGSMIYEKKPWSYYFVNIGYYFVALIIGGAIFAVWR